MTSQPQLARKTYTPARILITGVDGSGKSLGGLYLAKGLLQPGQNLVVIDTEGGKINQYAELFKFHTLPLPPPFTPENYIQAIQTALTTSNIGVLMVDNISREWVGIEEEKDKFVFDNPERDKWGAWSLFKPRHYAFMKVLLNVPCHVIATATSKTETVVGGDGKMKLLPGETILKKETGCDFNPEFKCFGDGHYFAVKSSAGSFDGSTFTPLDWSDAGDKLNEGHGGMLYDHLHANAVMSREAMKDALTTRFTGDELKALWKGWEDAPMATSPKELNDDDYTKYYDYCMKQEVKK